MIHSLHESCPPLPSEFFLEHSVAKFATFLETIGVTLGRYGVKEKTKILKKIRNIRLSMFISHNIFLNILSHSII